MSQVVVVAYMYIIDMYMYILAVLHWVLCENTVYDVCQCFSACFSVSLSPHKLVNITR